jgi:NADH-quinone oxidoreductase subunit J
MLESILFCAFAALTVGGAFAVAFSRNLRRAAVSLILSFAGIAGLLFILRAEFLAAAELLVAVGGITVWLLMGSFLTGGERGAKVLNGGPRSIALAVLAAALIGIPLLIVLPRTNWHAQPSIAQVPQPDHIDRIGQALIASHGHDAYLVPLELLSVILLTVIVGAAYLARPRRPLAPTGPRHIQTLAPSPVLPRRKNGPSGGRPR